MNSEEKALKLIEDSLNKKCNGLECKVVKNNIELRLENIRLNKQIDLMAICILSREIGKNTCQFNESCTKYEKGRDIHCKDCIKHYFEKLAERKSEE